MRLLFMVFVVFIAHQHIPIYRSYLKSPKRQLNRGISPGLLKLRLNGPVEWAGSIVSALTVLDATG